MSEGQRQKFRTGGVIRQASNEDCINSPRRGVSCNRIVFPEPLHASKVSAEVLPIAVSITSLKGASRISVEAHGLRIISFFGGYFIMAIRIRFIQRSEKITTLMLWLSLEYQYSLLLINFILVDLSKYTKFKVNEFVCYLPLIMLKRKGEILLQITNPLVGI